MKKITNKKNKGFTLIEVLVSAVILVVCMAGIMNSFAVGSYFKKNTEEITNAAFLAQEVMNAAVYIYAPGIEPIDEEYSCHEPFSNYSWKIKTKDISGTLKQITVQVMTPPTSKLRRTVELTALKAKNSY